MSISINSGFGRPIAKAGKKLITIVTNQEEIAQNEIPVRNSISLAKTDTLKFQHIVDTEADRSILYITGPSGSGKSTYTLNYLKEYRLAFKKRPIYILSALTEDETLDKMVGLKRILIDDKIHTQPLDAEMFKESCVVADDVDVIGDKKQREAVITLINQILEIGRHFKTTLIMTNHLATNGRDTRRILNEANTVTFFPHSGSSRGIKYLMTEYCGIDKKDLIKAKKSGSRSCTIFKNYPCVILTEKEIWQPDCEDD